MTAHTAGYIFMTACGKWAVLRKGLLNKFVVLFTVGGKTVFQNTAILSHFTTQTRSQEAEATGFYVHKSSFFLDPDAAFSS